MVDTAQNPVQTQLTVTTLKGPAANFHDTPLQQLHDQATSPAKTHTILVNAMQLEEQSMRLFLSPSKGAKKPSVIGFHILFPTL
jgi:hypothetical protein